MRFVFNERKAAQGAAILIKRNGGRLPYLALIKLLYFADRKALLERGRLITGDRLVSMPHGPVLSRVLDMINQGSPEEHREWYEYVSEPSGYDVTLAKPEPDDDELSDYEIGVLNQTYEQLGHLTKWQLRDLSHKLPEWRDPQGSMIPIDPAEILRIEGRPDDVIERSARDAVEDAFFESLESPF
jgi:uncharacterized phage-associated protein